MAKYFYRFFIILLTIVSFSIIFLTFFGIETSKFDELIKNEANTLNKYVRLDFNNTKIHLNPTEFNISVKLINPKVLIKDDEITLSQLDLFLPLQSFVTSNFILQRSEIAFSRNSIKDLTKITNIFIPKILNKKLKKIFHRGTVEGKFIIPFKKDGTLGEDYGFIGKISSAEINISKEISLKEFTAKINHKIFGGKDSFKIIVEDGYIYNLKLAGSIINLNRQKNITKINNLLKTKGNLNFSQIKKVTKLFNLNLNNLKDANGSIDLNTSIEFDFTKKLKIKNLKYSTQGQLSNFEIDINQNKNIKKYLPQYESKIKFKNTNIILKNDKSYQTAELSGFVKIKDSFDLFKLTETFNHSNKSYKIKGDFELNNTIIKIPNLNYTKENKKKSSINFDIQFKPNKYLTIVELFFLENKTKLSFSNIKLNSNFEVEDFSKIKIKTFNENKKNNDFFIEKSKKTIVSGKIFDAQPLLKSLFTNNGKKLFSKNLSSEIKINFKKVLTGTNDDVSLIGVIASIKNGSFEKLSLKGNFSENEIVEMSIYQVNKDQTTIQLISDRARPFVKNFKFIKGFEGGVLEYESLISKNTSTSLLVINDFKVSEVPALAQLFTLASLQGIADTLSGEGIRFDSFEMKSTSEKNLFTIDDALAMGPAVSILLDGYVDKGKTVSLRGTLVPATKLNSIIATIPVVGEILVGKKTGEGIVGVSFKMKGPPSDIKTNVNPIKTLTPRFIVRAIEKIKKKNENKTK